MTITKDHYKMRGIALYVMSMLLLSVVLFNLNNPSISVAYGDKGNNNNNHNNNNNKVNNHSLINDISDQVVTSNLGANKEQVQLVLQQIQTQIALTSGQDKATKAINQINSIIDLNPNGPLAQSLLSLAKRQAAGNTDVVIKAATQIAGKISSGGDDLGQPLAAQDLGQPLAAQDLGQPLAAQDLGQPLAAQQAGTSSSSPLSFLSPQASSSSDETTSNENSQQQETPNQPNTSVDSSSQVVTNSLQQPVTSSQQQQQQPVTSSSQQLVTSQQTVVDKPPVA